MGKTIAVAAHKGGTGKTTTVYYLAQLLQKKGMKVLAVDLDPQANLTKAFSGKKGDDIEDTLPSAIRDGKKTPVLDCFGVSVVPSDITMTYIEDSISEPLGEVLKRKLEEAGEYDITLLDCPPGAGNSIAFNALSVSDYLLIPAEADDFSVDAVDTMMELAGSIPTLKPLGILITKFRRNGGSIYYAFSDLMHQRYGKLVFSVPIWDTVKIKEAIAFNTPVSDYVKKHEYPYGMLCKEVLERLDGELLF